MSSYTDNSIYEMLSGRSLKFYQKNTCTMVYDKRLKNSFLQANNIKNNTDKFVFSKSSIDRLKNMDISKIKTNELSFLYNRDSFSNIGIITDINNSIGLFYCIGVNDIHLIIRSGRRKNNTINISNNGSEDFTEWSNTFVSNIIITYDFETIENQICNAISWIYNFDNLTCNIEMAKEIKKICEQKHIDITKLDCVTKNQNEYIYNIYQDYKIKHEKSILALKMFLFVKLAKTIDKTFISEEPSFFEKRKGNNLNKEFIIIDSFYNENICVINPFSVKGFFRNQPYKNSQSKICYKKIYIDSFMKNGYNRKSNKIKLENI